ncbi:MAG: hypothetical protein AB1523_06700 [Bacillota bacterium]
MRTLSAIKYEIKFQMRHGFYYACLLLTVIYVVGLRMIPENLRAVVSSLVIFTDPSVLGFFFIGGIVLLEKGQNTLESLFVTPLKVSEYIWAKVASLSMLSLSSSLAIAFFSLGGRFNLFWLILGVGLSSVLFSLVGFALAARAESLNQYFFFYSFPTAIFILLLLKYLGLPDIGLFYLLPTKPALLLIESAMKGVTLFDVVYAVATLCAWIVIAYKWAYRWFYMYTVLGIEGGRG